MPILPGIMPIQSYNGFKRMTTLSKTIVPDAIHEALEPIKDDDKAVKQYGIKLAIEMCKKLKTMQVTSAITLIKFIIRTRFPGSIFTRSIWKRACD